MEQGGPDQSRDAAIQIFLVPIMGQPPKTIMQFSVSFITSSQPHKFPLLLNPRLVSNAGVLLKMEDDTGPGSESGKVSSVVKKFQAQTGRFRLNNLIEHRQQTCQQVQTQGPWVYVKSRRWESIKQESTDNDCCCALGFFQLTSEAFRQSLGCWITGLRDLTHSGLVIREHDWRSSKC